MPETIPVTLPAMGESVTEGTVMEWRKQAGDAVDEGEVIADVTTDKVDVEVSAPVAGVLSRIVADAGATVAVGATMAEITVGAGNGATPAADPSSHGMGKAAPSPGPAEAATAAEAEQGAAPATPAAPMAAAPFADAPPAAAPPGDAPAAPLADAAFEGAVEVTLPAMGESVTEGTVSQWVKVVGDAVDQGETLVEVTTDKVDVEVPAPATGVLGEIRAAAGATVAVGGVLGVVTVGPGAPSAAVPIAVPVATTPAPADPAAEAAEAPATATAPPRAAQERAPIPPADEDGSGRRVSPLARRAAALAGVDVAQLQGSGASGAVRTADVAAALLARLSSTNGSAPASAPARASAPAAPISPGAPPSGSVPLRGPAMALANAMEQSREIPTATSFRAIEVDVLDDRRGRLNAALKATGRPEKVSFTHLIGYAVALAAARQPSMTAHFERTADNQGLRVTPGVHLGLAVDTTRKDGSRFLVVPVIRNAADRDFAGFRGEYERVVGLARDGKLTADDMRGASVQLTNPGGIGTVASVPRLTVGTGTIVATGSIDLPPGLRSLDAAHAAELGVSKVMTLTSTYDHRVIQGAESGEFLRHVEALLHGDDGFYEGVFESLGLAAPPPPDAAAPSAIMSAPVVPATTTSGGDAAAITPGPATAADHEMLAAVSAGMSLVKGYRSFGHHAAQLDPLGTLPPGDETMDETRLGLTPELMSRVPADVLRTYVAGRTLADIVPRLREVYCGTIAYQIEHLTSHEQRVWLREQIEAGHHRVTLTPEKRTTLLSRLTKVDAMERYLRKAFLGQKTFSIEGLDAMVPMLEEFINLVAADGITQVVMGMAHRGRLATITHVANRTYESILVAFESGEQKRQLGEEPNDPTGDVKYHLGATGTYLSESGTPVVIKLLNNPSHLEQVDPVVEGWARADQTTRMGAELVVDPRRAAPVLIHGDAAMSGQGIVAEVFNMQSLAGYAVGGTVHVISNNQVGFTAEPHEGRSTRYASDLAKGFDVPVIHVNADDLDACIAAMRLAHDYRRNFHRDVLIDLVGYRRFGHNETDEPAYTQPLMYERIKQHATAREIFAEKLIQDGLITADQARAQADEAYARVQAAHQRVKESLAADAQESPETHHGSDESDLDLATGVGEELLRGITGQLMTVPPRFTINTKLSRQLKKRVETIQGGEVDWASAESLAIGSLVMQGKAVRLTGQDTERGTFSQRHLVYHDAGTGSTWCPLQHLVAASATFELHNSPLSELAAVGFEYGYSAAAPDALVLWEAQFGDFVNGAQMMVDQFISSGAAKWGMQSRLVLLLPHGYEGQGPEHSSARLERFLQLSANGNMRIAYPSTASQYFHLLRLQAQSPRPRPLVVMTPKSLLRSHAASSPLRELVDGRFRVVIDDPVVTDERREEVHTLVLCTGKIYHDIDASPLRAAAHRTAVARVEMLDPLPLDEIIALVCSYPKLEQLFWVQEEPKNMGAWAHVSRPVGRMRPYHIRWDYIGRPRRASPSEGFHGAHAVEQERIVREALTIERTSAEEALNAARSGATL